jgi:hypothetical protein
MQETQNSGFNFGTVIDDAKRVITNPAEFYRNMPTTGGYGNPLIFAIVMAVISGLIGAVLSVLGLGNADALGGAALGVAAIIVMPIFAVIGSFIGGAILFVIWRLTGSDKSYEAAVRSAAYSFAIMPIGILFSVVPYLGQAIQTLWSMFLGYTSSVEVGKVKDQTAKIIFGVLAAIFVITGFNAERTANRFADRAERYEEQLEKSGFGQAIKKFEDGEEISAEEAGKAAGEFLKSLEKFSKGIEEATKAEEAAEESN